MKKINKKYLILGISLLLCCSIGLTVAFSKDISNILTNTFFVGSVESEIEEEKPIVDGSIINKNPKVKNKGSVDALVRVRITVSPEELCNPTNLNNDDSILKINIDNQSWEYDDGYYYYNGVLEAGKTIDVFDEVILNTGNSYKTIKDLLKDYQEFNIAIYQETISSTATDSSGTEKNPYDNYGNYNFDAAKVIWSIYEDLNK